MSLPLPWPSTKQICAPMATGNRHSSTSVFWGKQRTDDDSDNAATAICRRRPLQGSGATPLLLTLLVILLTASACRPIRATAKLGLLASFEGLYRRNGYDALAAMRQALAAAPDAAADLLPLALDLTLDPERAMQKLLADHSVRAVIGPLTLQSAGKLQSEYPPTAWYVPFAISASGEFVPVTAFDAWAKPLFLAVANAMQQAGCNRLVVAGWPVAWPAAPFSQWAAAADMPLVVSNDLAVVQADDAVFYLGEPAAAAAHLQRLRQRFDELPFVLGPSGEDPVFVEHSPDIHAVYWATWSDAGYVEWASSHSPGTRMAYLVYRATEAALLNSKFAPPADATSWRVEVMVLSNYR